MRAGDVSQRMSFNPLVTGNSVCMRNEPHRYGSVPRSRRPLFIGACLAMGVLAFIAGIAVNWVTGSAVEWAWLVAAVGFTVGVFAIYLWIRLSD